MKKTIQPTGPRYVLNETSDGINFSIASDRTVLLLIFQLVFTLISLQGVFVYVRQLITNFELMSLFAAGVFLFIAYKAARPAIWMLAGVESITVSRAEIVTSRKVFGLGRMNRYLSEHVKNLRAITDATPVSSYNGHGDGALAFDYGSETYRIASGLNQVDGVQMVKEISRRFPEYARLM